MDPRLEAISEEAARAMFSVVRGVAASDAWLDFVRTRHPEAAQLLGKLAMANIAIDLLLDNGDLSEDAAQQERVDAVDSVAAELPRETWEEIHELKAALETLQADARRFERDVVDIRDASPRERAHAS
jgi:hypothetical protein